MQERQPLSLTVREHMRREIARQTEQFLRGGGHIEQLRGVAPAAPRPVGAVWWETRGSGVLLRGH